MRVLAAFAIVCALSLFTCGEADQSPKQILTQIEQDCLDEFGFASLAAIPARDKVYFDICVGDNE